MILVKCFIPQGVPEGYYEIPLGEPDIKREGKDITILTIGATLYPVLKAADILQQTYGLSAEVIDARSLVPFNYEPVIESVKKTGRIVLASDASITWFFPERDGTDHNRTCIRLS